MDSIKDSTKVLITPDSGLRSDLGFQPSDFPSLTPVRSLQDLQNHVERAVQVGGSPEINREACVVRPGNGVAVGKEEVDQLLPVVSAGENAKRRHPAGAQKLSIDG